ncbi:hypothetical protein ACFYPC_27335 [Streptomyces sp. NPDC005808]|uniref:hypothetical protein n=1 Tax=Streptomyces sp. NPDC005808 TaxID=3364734 RepID=UPI0036841294
MQSELPRLKAMFAVAVAVLALAFSAGTASASTADATSPYASQAKQAGLTTSQTAALQKEVNRYLAQTGGKQVAANVIDLGGKSLMSVALPGEAHPRDMTDGVLVNVCDDSWADYGWFCAWSGTSFTGSSIAMYGCADYVIPWTANGSWENNQTTGTVARFKDNSGFIGWEDEGAYDNDWDAPWYWVHWVRNC